MRTRIAQSCESRLRNRRVPGKTVARAEGGATFGGKHYKFVDLPGTCSLLSTSVDEEIARDFILFGRPDCIVIVVDATLLERNLNLVLQILEITDRVVVCLNLMDEACRKGITIDHQELARELGVPVIPTVGRTSQGIGDLISATAKVCSGKGQIRPRRVVTSGPVAAAIEDLAQVIQTRCPALPSARWVAIRLLEDDARVDRAITAAELVPMSKDASTEILRRAQMLRHGLDIAFRDRFVETVFDDARRIANYTIQTAEGPVSDWDARCGAIFRLRPAGRGPLGPRQFDGGSGGAGRRRYGMCST